MLAEIRTIEVLGRSLGDGADLLLFKIQRVRRGEQFPDVTLDDFASSPPTRNRRLFGSRPLTRLLFRSYLVNDICFRTD